MRYVVSRVRYLVGTMAMALMLLAVSQAQAIVMFDFEALADGDNAGAISAYMTNVMQSSVDPKIEPGVTVTWGVAKENGWDGTYIENVAGKSLVIEFAHPLSFVAFDLTLFNTNGFLVKAMHGSDVVGGGGIGCCLPTSVPLSVHFNVAGTGTDRLLFSSTTAGFRLGIDNLQVIPNPEPGTLLLMSGGLVGLGFVVRRRRQMQP